MLRISFLLCVHVNVYGLCEFLFTEHIRATNQEAPCSDFIAVFHICNIGTIIMNSYTKLLYKDYSRSMLNTLKSLSILQNPG